MYGLLPVELPLSIKQFSKVAISGAVLLFILTLYTNQVFHNGVWGPLHNKSVKPELEISNAKIQEDILTFKVYRIEGADVYGSFLIGITLKDENGKTILQKNGEELARFPLTRIKNDYVAQSSYGKHSLNHSIWEVKQPLQSEVMFLWTCPKVTTN